MVFFQIDFSRFLTVYIGQGLIVAFFIFLTYKILQRGKNKLNLILSGYYVFIIIAFSINFIYAPLTDIAVIIVLNKLTNFFAIFGMVFLLIYCLILFRGEKGFSNKILIAIIIIYALLLSYTFFIPGGVTISPSTLWKPVWSQFYFLYFLIVVSAFCVIPTLILVYWIYQKLEDAEIRKRWRNFDIGLGGIYFLMYGTMTANLLDDTLFRTIWSFLLLSMFIWGFLMYYGIGKEIE